MIGLVFFACLTSLAHSGHITHDLGGDDGFGKATSYQSIHMNHFHAVPTFIKKEYKHLLDHPLPAGKSSSKLEIHHGGKHDHGYAIVDAHNSAHGSGLGGNSDGHEGSDLSDHGSAGLSGHVGAGFGGHEGAGFGGHEGASLDGHANAALSHGASGGYSVHDQNEELLQHQLAQNAQSHGSLHLQAAAAFAHGGGSLGHGEASLSHSGAALGHGGASIGHYRSAAGGHHGYEAAIANAALHFQNGGLEGHGHSS